MDSSLSSLELSDRDIGNLPHDIRRKFLLAFGLADRTKSSCMHISSHSESLLKFIKALVKRFDKVVANRAVDCQEREVEFILEVIANDNMPLNDLDFEIVVDNARMRAEYFNRTVLWTTNELYEKCLGESSINNVDIVMDWERQKKVFSIRNDATVYYPMFQFENGLPRPTLQEILKIFPDDMTGWQIAFWFESGNGWLGGAVPQDCLASRSRDVLYAASQLNYDHIG